MDIAALMRYLGRYFVSRGLFRFLPRGRLGALLGVVIGLVVLFAVGKAHASGNVTVRYGYSSYHVTSHASRPTREEACQQVNIDDGGSAWSWDGGDRCLNNGGPGGANIEGTGSAGAYCPDNATLTNVFNGSSGTTSTSCVCNSTYSASGDAATCVPAVTAPTGCTAGASHGDSVQQYSISGGSSYVCLAGCESRAKLVGGADVGGGMQYSAWGPFVDSGKACSPGNSVVLGAPAETYKPGNCPGTINGTAVPGGVPCAKNTTGSESTTSSASAASGAASSSATGTTTSRTETTCDAVSGQCSSTTTTTTVDKVSGKTDTATKTEDKPQKAFCEENPNLGICKDGKFSGSCTTGYSCSGDAIQCAIAQGQRELSCKFAEESDLSRAGTAAMGASAPGLSASSVTFSLEGRIDDTPLFGTNSCSITDSTVSVGGNPITIPFTRLCGNLAVIAVALKSFALLIAGFIVFRRTG